MGSLRTDASCMHMTLTQARRFTQSADSMGLSQASILLTGQMARTVISLCAVVAGGVLVRGHRQALNPSL